MQLVIKLDTQGVVAIIEREGEEGVDGVSFGLKRVVEKKNRVA